MADRLKFYLRKDSTNYYKVEGNGSITTTTTPAPVTMPTDWDTMKISYRRFVDAPGVIKSYTTPLNFIDDGAKILRYLFVTQGVEAKCILYIEREKNIFEFQSFFAAELNFGTYQDKWGSGGRVEITALEGGLHALLKSRKSQKYDIPIEHNDSISVYADGRHFEATYDWSTGDLGNLTIQNNDRLFFPIGFANYEANNIFSRVIYPKSQQWHTGIPQVPLAWLQTDLTTTGTITVDAEVHVFINGFITNAVTFKVYIGRMDSSGNFNSAALYTHGSTFGGGTNNSVIFNVNNFANSFQAGYTYWLFIRLEDTTNIPSHDCTVNINKFDLSYSFSQRLPVTTLRGYRYSTALKKAINTLTDGRYSVKSNGFLDFPTYPRQFDINPYFDIITCGDALRGLGTSQNPAKIKTSLNDMEQDLKSRYCAFIGVENDKVVIDRLDYFYKKTTLIRHLGKVSKLTISPATDFFVNNVKVGYPENTTDTANGRYEFNEQQHFEIPFEANSYGDMDLVSPYVTSMYYIELTRANLSGKATTDADSDNGIFLLATQAGIDGLTGAQLLERQGSVNAAVPEPSSVFNLGYSPQRCMLRNLPLWQSMLTGLQNKTIKFTAATKFTKTTAGLQLSSQMFTSSPIIEGVDINPDSYSNQALFKPLIFEFEVVVDDVDTLLSQIEVNPYGQFQFSYEYHWLQVAEFSGYIFDISFSHKDKSILQCKLLCGSAVNLEQMITD